MILTIDEPGVALGFAGIGTGRNVALPGQFIQQDSDKACWVNIETSTKICVWYVVGRRRRFEPFANIVGFSWQE